MFIIPGARAAVIPVVVIYIGMVDDCCPGVNGRAVTGVISVHVGVIHIPGRQESPVQAWNIDVYADIHARAHRCPSVIAAATSPDNPGWCPFITGNPYPSKVIIVIPSAVMERCPTPREVRYPGVAVIGHYPVSVGFVGMKVSSHVRYPHPAISAVVDPPAVRSQLIVENIEADAPVVVVIIIFIIVSIPFVVIVVGSTLRVNAIAGEAGSQH
jgi:hypothetical protein